MEHEEDIIIVIRRVLANQEEKMKEHEKEQKEEGDDFDNEDEKGDDDDEDEDEDEDDDDDGYKGDCYSDGKDADEIEVQDKIHLRIKEEQPQDEAAKVEEEMEG